MKIRMHNGLFIPGAQVRKKKKQKKHESPYTDDLPHYHLDLCKGSHTTHTEKKNEYMR